MRHSILRLAIALSLAGALAVAFHSAVNAQVYGDRYSGYGDGYGYEGSGYGYYGAGASYEGPNRELMLHSTGP